MDNVQRLQVPGSTTRRPPIVTVDSIPFGQILRSAADGIPSFVAWLTRNKRIRPANEVVKVNLGAGLSVADGWIHIEASLKTLLRNHPALLKLFYRVSTSRNWYSEEGFVSALCNHEYIHHKLEYGLPFVSNCVD